MKSSLLRSLGLSAAFGVTSLAPLSVRAESAPDPAGIEFFESKIRPLLVENCYTCHSANTNAKGGLRVDDRNGLLDGGNRGAAVVPNDVEGSLLLTAVKHEAGVPSMPPGKKLSDEEISLLTKWIETGAVWPTVEVTHELSETPSDYAELAATHWAWQPLKSATAPAVKNESWPLSNIDRFILARLEEKGLEPVRAADRVALIRRVTFDLTGLPPTPAEIQAFEADQSPDAYANLVDRLLASPAFGEHWGRHWLDVARYGESTGSSRNVPYPHAWRYRDYVIAAFNADKPFDKFIHEQIAGDLLPAENEVDKQENLVATGFLALGVKDVNQRFKNRFIMDNIDEQIDTTTRAFLGLTVACARCHDHKFDPIPTSDYYALAGIFESSDMCAGVRNKMGGGGLDYYDKAMLIEVGGDVHPDLVAKNSAELEKVKQELEEARKQFQKLRDTPEGDELAPNGRPRKTVARNRMNRIQQQLENLQDPAAFSAVAYGVRDAAKITDANIRIRGEAELIGPAVKRGFLSLMPHVPAPEIGTDTSGRLQLAQWLSHPENSLTSRVIVNRIWSHLFHQGLVATVDNFGVTGDKPTHPELLDYLALQFVQEGWSIKKTVRNLVLTQAYQMSSDRSERGIAEDPANRLVWRHTPRRLTAEEIRDAILADSGRLLHGIPATQPTHELKVIEMRNNGPEAVEIKSQAASSVHRSVYLPLLRGLVPESLQVFDFAEQGMVTGARDVTTVAPQALYMLNDPLVWTSSLKLAENLLQQTEADDQQRVTLAYRTIFGRDPRSSELELAQAYVAEFISNRPDEEDSSESEAQADPVPAETPETEPVLVAAATTGNGNGGANVNPDEADQTDVAVEVEKIVINDVETAAWTSFCQALFGSAEFRYLK
ncbi:PSD1 and planctomycete cytochrome C domain-containing protein [Planctomicrobium sp. SH668]|uniref:PSD1 and planctomycete cytochrome C domain-containing protein n=1 Tax=Planctomicrobium sp. SH668 TaxID=3448126 RepID=UPI003F5B6EF6